MHLLRPDPSLESQIGRSRLMGSRRVTLSCAGRGAVSRQVEVAGGEVLRPELRLPLSAPVAKVQVAARPKPTPKNLAIGWTMTALLGVGRSEAAGGGA